MSLKKESSGQTESILRYFEEWAGTDSNPRPPEKSRELRASGSIERLSTLDKGIQSNSR